MISLLATFQPSEEQFLCVGLRRHRWAAKGCQRPAPCDYITPPEKHSEHFERFAKHKATAPDRNSVQLHLYVYCICTLLNVRCVEVWLPSSVWLQATKEEPAQPNKPKFLSKAGWVKKSHGRLLASYKDRYVQVEKTEMVVYENEVRLSLFLESRLLPSSCWEGSLCSRTCRTAWRDWTWKAMTSAMN